MIGRMACGLAFLFVTGLGATARDATIGGVSVSLTAPQGQCELDANRPSDARALNFAQTVAGSLHELLATYADCAQLEAWRNGTRPVLDDFLYQTSVRMGSATATTETIKQECNGIRSVSRQSTAETAAEMDQRAAQFIKTLKFPDFRRLGVAAEDNKTCYMALLLSLELGDETAVAILMAITVVKGKMVAYGMCKPYSGAGAISRMLAQHRINVATFLAANEQ